MQTFADIMVLITSGTFLLITGQYLYTEFKSRYKDYGIESRNREEIRSLSDCVEALSKEVKELRSEIHECTQDYKDLIIQNRELMRLVDGDKGN